jgi:YfiH family protein
VRQADLLLPEWPLPAGVRAAFTLRTGGVSAPPFDSLNLGAHVGDDPEAVGENRVRVRRLLRLPAEPAWLDQIHACGVLDLDRESERANVSPGPADAALSRAAGRVCAIQVADCMPVLFAAADGSAVGAAHAGWRGLAGGVLESTVRALQVPPGELLAWLGPAISQRYFEVGEEVRNAFLAAGPKAARAFVANARGRWQCDLYALARGRLAALGVTRIHGGLWCTYADSGRFFSYRRDRRCGRMAALIWKE